MATVEIKISDELLKAAKVPRERSSEEVAKLFGVGGLPRTGNLVGSGVVS